VVWQIELIEIETKSKKRKKDEFARIAAHKISVSVVIARRAESY